MNENRVVLELKNIQKSFSGKKANDDISFDLRSGEIHALLGENGAGKTTLMNILYGLYHPDGGEIFIDGERKIIHSPHDAIACGIGMVHQHFMLVPPLTVLDNIMLGTLRGTAPIPLKAIREKIEALCAKYNFSIDPEQRVMDLSVGKQQMVELIKALYREARILIMDEPTAVLTPLEVDELFRSLNDFAEAGKSIVFISHKLWEVMRISHRVTVLRNGRVIDTVPSSSTTREELAAKMVGRTIVSRYEKEKPRSESVVFSMENISAPADYGGTTLENISFSVREGEILGVAGVDGNGQQELCELINGMKKAEEGTIRFLNEDITSLSVRERIDRRMVSIPEDRLKHGLVLDFSVAENLVLDTYAGEPFTHKGFYRPARVHEEALRKIADFDIRPAAPEMAVRKMSGGNQQKVVLARALSKNPRFILAMHPTRGLDVGAAEFVHMRLLSGKAGGAGVLVVSADLDEILLIADRVIVLYEGSVSGEFIPGDIGFAEIGLMMGGKEHALKEGN